MTVEKSKVRAAGAGSVVGSVEAVVDSIGAVEVALSVDSIGVVEAALSSDGDEVAGTSGCGETHDASDAVKRPIDKNFKRLFMYTPNVSYDNA